MYLIFALCAATLNAKAADLVYSEYTNTGIRLTSQGPSHRVASVLKCAMDCVQWAQNCRSFIYNKTTGECSPGTWAIEPLTPFGVVFSGELYYGTGSVCDNALAKFTLKQNGIFSTCMWVSTFETDYTSARAFCTDLGAHLYTAKVPEKKYILLDELKKTTFSDYWIGLDDIVEEGVYRWVDDQSIFNFTFPFFAANEPDNLGDEDCVQYKKDIFPFNDARCSFSCRFVCEFGPLI